MPVAQWPGTKLDATTTLAQAHSKASASSPKATLWRSCDRCRRPLEGSTARSGRARDGERFQVWFLCDPCDADLLQWFAEGRISDRLSSTEPDTSDITSP